MTPLEITTPEPLPEERSTEAALRPSRLDEFVGQVNLKASLQIAIEAAKARGDTLDHMLFFGPPGLGKTTLATLLAREMGVQLRATSGPVLEKPGDLVSILTTLGKGDILFIDEIHRLRPVMEEFLYPAMEDFSVNFVMDKGLNARTMRIPLRPFTLVAATTRPGMLSSPLRERFGIFHHLDFYSVEDLSAIVMRSASILEVAIEPSGGDAIARRSRRRWPTGSSPPRPRTTPGGSARGSPRGG